MENCRNECCSAADHEHILSDQTVHESVTKLSMSCSGLNNSIQEPAFVDCLPAEEPWCIASQRMEVSCGLDSSYSEASVIETQV